MKIVSSGNDVYSSGFQKGQSIIWYLNIKLPLIQRIIHVSVIYRQSPIFSSVTKKLF